MLYKNANIANIIIVYIHYFLHKFYSFYLYFSYYLSLKIEAMLFKLSLIKMATVCSGPAFCPDYTNIKMSVNLFSKILGFNSLTSIS